MEYGGTCHISGRPYTVFRWRPGNDARYKKTIICQEVAKAKNVCQVCLLDLDYNLPVQVRDKALGIEEENLPDSIAGKEFALNRMEEQGQLERAQFGGSGPNELLNKLQRSEPYYKRNKAKICSFFVKGECKRGAECPYRHEMPTTGPLSEQNIRDRYYGTNDPVAQKMLKKASEKKTITPPEDKSITTLFVGGVGETVSEEDLRGVFYAYGELKSVKCIASRNCAFVTFVTRQAAEAAIQKTAVDLTIKGEKLKVLWGQPKKNDRKEQDKAVAPGTLPTSRKLSELYPSMDPAQMGAFVPNKRDNDQDSKDPSSTDGKKAKV